MPPLDKDNDNHLDEEHFEIGPGDVVQLRSGGPLMTVEFVYNDDDTDQLMAECTWFDDAGKCRTKAFAAVALTAGDEQDDMFDDDDSSD